MAGAFSALEFSNAFDIGGVVPPVSTVGVPVFHETLLYVVRLKEGDVSTPGIVNGLLEHVFDSLVYIPSIAGSFVYVSGMFDGVATSAELPVLYETFVGIAGLKEGFGHTLEATETLVYVLALLNGDAADTLNLTAAMGYSPKLLDGMSVYD